MTFTLTLSYSVYLIILRLFCDLTLVLAYVFSGVWCRNYTENKLPNNAVIPIGVAASRHAATLVYIGSGRVMWHLKYSRWHVVVESHFGPVIAIAPPPTHSWGSGYVCVCMWCKLNLWCIIEHGTYAKSCFSFSQKFRSMALELRSPTERTFNCCNFVVHAWHVCVCVRVVL